MKWIGQHIYDLTSRFRSDVYLEDISTGTIASGAHLGLDSNNKIVKAVDGGGDITSVALSADDENTSTASSGVANFIISGGAGIDTTLAGSTVTITGETASASNAGIVELATTAETTTGTDTARAVTPDGLKDGYQGSTNVTTLGTITTGVWNGTPIGGNFISATQPNIDSIGTDGDNLSILADTLTMASTTASKPAVDLYNQADDATGPIITLANQRYDGSIQAGEYNDYLGKIFFKGYNDQGTPAAKYYAIISSQIHDATSGEESGILNLQVANHDGGLGTGLKLTGGSENDEIDVTVGLGANSVVTIPGDIDLAGDIDVDGTLETDALTIGGAAIAAIGTTAITTLGTIGTGVWNGDPIGNAYLDADTAHLSGTQTFTGTKTLNSFKGTGGATVTNILDEDAMGSDSATSLATQQSIKAYVDSTHATVQTGKNYRILNTSFRDDIGTTKHYLPLKSQDEQTVLTREEVSELSVCDGRLVSATVRVENMQGTTGDFTLTMGVETNVVGETYGGFSVIETEVLTVHTGDDHHLFHFVFDTAKHWDSTDMFAVSIQSSSDEWGTVERFFVTLVIEDDWSTYLAGASREIDSTPT